MSTLLCSLVTGKKLSLEQQSTGSYILNVTVNNPEDQTQRLGTMNFKVLDAPSLPNLGMCSNLESLRTRKRASSTSNEAFAIGLSVSLTQARVWFRRALQLDHSDDVARARLVDAYFSKKDYARRQSLLRRRRNGND